MNVSLADKLQINSSNINLLRFICAIAVIISHSFAVTQNRDDFVTVFSNGQCSLGGIAVAVFFFLSGLYVTKSLEKSKSIGSFMKKRCVRIFPQLWIVVIASVIAGLFLTNLTIKEYLTNGATYKYLLNMVFVPIHDLPGVFEGMPYQTVNGPLWTLPVEFACYIGLAILALIAIGIAKAKKRDKTNRMVLDVIAMVLIVIMYVAVLYLYPNSMYVTIARPIVVFLEGMLFYDFKDKIKLNWIVGILFLIALVALCKTPVFNIAFVILFPYGFLSIVLGLPQLAKNPTIFKISYEMYLVGWPIQQVLMYAFAKQGMTPMINWLITLPIDIVVGFGVYWLSELLIKKTTKKRV